MTIYHQTNFQCDGCHDTIESSSEDIPGLVIELKKEGWSFHYDVYGNVIHHDFCSSCVDDGTPELIREKMYKLRENSNE